MAKLLLWMVNLSCRTTWQSSNWVPIKLKITRVVLTKQTVNDPHVQKKCWRISSFVPHCWGTWLSMDGVFSHWQVFSMLPCCFLKGQPSWVSYLIHTSSRWTTPVAFAIISSGYKEFFNVIGEPSCYVF